MFAERDKVLRFVETIYNVQQELGIKDEEVISILQDIASKYTIYKKIIILSIFL
jgi:hypothetical protein